MRTYDLLRELPLDVADVRLERDSVAVAAGFERVTTTVVLRGDGLEGRGEDVSYSADDQGAIVDGLHERLAGTYTLESFSRRLDHVELWTAAPRQTAATDYRRWAFESAALDLALRRAGRTLAEALGGEQRPMRFVVSTRIDPREWLAVSPGLEFKLDASTDWGDEQMHAYAATGRVPVIDLKGRYEGYFEGTEFDAGLYARVAAAFPDAVLEDPADRPEAYAALAGAERRLSWDAPIHSVEDVDALPVPPRHLNIKPSRFGTLARLLDCVDACRERGIAMYAGGQFELGVGRAQAQQLAGVLYPAAPNDLAPSEYNEGGARPGLPASPLPVPPRAPGFGPAEA